MRTLLLCFEPGDAELLTPFGQVLAQPFDVLSLSGPAPLDLGAETVFHADLNEIPLADTIDKALAAFAGNYTHIALLSSMRGKDYGARLAGRMDAVMVTDAITVESPQVFHRTMLAGAVIATVEVTALPVVLTVRPSGFGQPVRGGTSNHQSVSLELAPRSRRLSATASHDGRPDLTQARVVVSGGRPLRDASTFEATIGALADKLGGAVGATRAAVDAGIAPNEIQVGQTGKIVAPDLYIAAGISGSTQHLAGIKDSKVIVAINKDPDAPIFAIADLGLVADLFEAVPDLIGKL